MTADEMFLLVDRAGREWKVELDRGRLVVDWRYDYVAGPEEARDAAALGVTMRTCLDAVLDDAQMREQARRRLCEGG